MEYTKLKRQQEIQRNMLAEFHDFCKKHDLKYYMFYGTLLGAVRHKGFIPWDYDIDLVMTRPEYEKFQRVQNLLPPHLSIWEVCYSEIKYAGLARLMFHDHDLGEIHVDIFILDFQKSGWLNNKFIRNLCGFLHIAKLSKSEKKILIKHFKGNLRKQGIIHLSKVARILLLGSANTERLIYKLRVNKKPADFFITLEDHNHFPTDYFKNVKLLDFDGHKFYAPEHEKELLTIMYGNYMKIPPEGEKWLSENNQF